MLSTALAISGMLATEAAARAGTSTTAVEVSFVTHVGEGAAGKKRFTRDGCYQIESGGSTGGATYARDSRTGCHRAVDVAPMFARLDAIGDGRLVRDAAKRAARGPAAGGTETEIVLIRTDGSRWRAANQSTDDDIQRAVNDLPTEISSGLKPPEAAAGSGAQLVVLSSESRDHLGRRSVGLAADGRWFCDRTTLGPHGDEPRLPAAKAAPVTNASARLNRILRGVNPPTSDDTPDKASGGVDVAVAWPGRELGALRASALKDTVAKRFSAEMTAFAPACDLR